MVSSWQLLRARFQKPKPENNMKSQEFKILSETWTPTYSIHVSKAINFFNISK